MGETPSRSAAAYTSASRPAGFVTPRTRAWGERAPHERHVAGAGKPEVGDELPLAEEVPRVLVARDARADAARRLRHGFAIASPVVVVRWEYYAGRQ